MAGMQEYLGSWAEPCWQESRQDAVTQVSQDASLFTNAKTWQEWTASDRHRVRDDVIIPFPSGRIVLIDMYQGPVCLLRQGRQR